MWMRHRQLNEALTQRICKYKGLIYKWSEYKLIK